MKLLDLYCGEGGAAIGYHQAGFTVTGVDNNPKVGRRYPYQFIHGDALAYLLTHGAEYDVIHASPPCQRYSAGTRSSDLRYPDLVEPTRRFLQETGLPYIIENVEGAPLIAPITLCGTMFTLATVQYEDHPVILHLQRHRQFESNIALHPPRRCVHRNVQWAGAYGGGRGDRHEAKNIRQGGFVPNKATQVALMGVDWNGTMRGLQQAIPPAYTAWLGGLIKTHLEGAPA